MGLSRAIAGEEAHFIIQSKDLGGNNEIDNEARFDVYLSLIDSDNLSVLLGSLEYVGNGKHLVKYTCFVSGDYALVVQDKAGENEWTSQPCCGARSRKWNGRQGC